MVATVQIKRTITNNQPPAANSLQPGELAVEMGNPLRLWVGVPAAAGAVGNMKLLAPSGAHTVSDNPPAAPAQGDLWLESDTMILWMWYDDGTSGQWVQVSGGGGGATGDWVEVAGDTMTGALTVNSTIHATGNISSNSWVVCGATSGSSSFVFGNAAAKYLNCDGTNYAFAPGNLNVSGAATTVGITNNGALTNNNAGVTVNNSGLTLNGAGAIIEMRPSGGSQINMHKGSSGFASQILGGNNGVARWGLNLGDLTGEGGGNSGSDFVISPYADDGSGIPGAAPLIIQRSTGNMSIGKDFSVNGAQNNYGVWSGKPGGGAWDANSDSRIKTVDGPYMQGLAQITQLNPVRYHYKGNDTPEPPKDPLWREADGEPPPVSVPYPNSQQYQVVDKEFVGFVAQDVEAIMPEMVGQKEAYIDGVAVSDLRTINVSALTYALVNAVKELSAEVDALKAQLNPARR